MKIFALISGVLSISLGSLGAILYGVPCSVAGLVFGICAIVLGINIKKQTNQQSGNAPFVCGLVGVIVAAIFTIGCAAVGSACEGYGCYGVLGTGCQVENDVNNALDQINDELGDWN